MSNKQNNDQKAEKKQSRKKIIRLVCSLFFLCVTIWIFLPVFALVLHAGMLFGVLSGILFLLCAFPKYSRLIFYKNKVTARICVAGFMVATVAAGGTFSVLLGGALKPAQPGKTIIVLGCQVRGETPSLMLQRRIDAALSYAEQNPESNIIASGGKGSGETISEAECIRRYLIAHGIDENRIFLEDQSTNTEENIKYSAEIIEREGLDPSVVIATSRFHQYRASLFAQKYNLDSSPLACGTQWWLAPGYWGREIFAVWRVWLLGY